MFSGTPQTHHPENKIHIQAAAHERSQAIVPGGNGMFRPTIVLDGEVVGTWGRTVARGEVVLQPHPFDPLPRSTADALQEAADAYGAYLGRPAPLA